MNHSLFDGIQLTHLYAVFARASGVAASIIFHFVSGGGLDDRKEDRCDETPPFYRLILVLLGTLAVFFFFVFVVASLVSNLLGFDQVRQIAIFHWKLALPLLLTYRFVWEYLRLSYQWVDEL